MRKQVLQHTADLLKPALMDYCPGYVVNKSLKSHSICYYLNGKQHRAEDQPPVLCFPLATATCQKQLRLKYASLHEHLSKTLKLVFYLCGQAAMTVSELIQSCASKRKKWYS